ncbi:MAG: DegT/DnrJ/EryC1/StrS family aminotransferase [Acidimicrobiia bacterium]
MTAGSSPAPALDPAGIPVVDLARHAASLEPALSDAVARVARSGQYLFGPELTAFEEEFAAFTGRRHCVGVASGTDALRLSLVAMGIRPGDEVLVPAFTAVPTAAAVCAAGATPVFVDVERETATIAPAAAAAAVTDRTRAVIPVHLYGRPSAIPDVGLPVLEDAAQATGALDPASGSVAAAYSFYPTKNLGGICDGGAVVTDDAALAAELRLLRAHGVTDAYVHTRVSTTARLSDLAAAALRVGLPRLAADNERRRAIAAAYRAAAPGSPGTPTTPGTCTTSASPGCPTATPSGPPHRSAPGCTTRGRSPNSPPTSTSCARRARKPRPGPPSAYPSPAFRS